MKYSFVFRSAAEYAAPGNELRGIQEAPGVPEFFHPTVTPLPEYFYQPAYYAQPVVSPRTVEEYAPPGYEARDQQFSDRFEEIRLRVQSRVDVAQSRFTEEAAFPEIRDALHQYGIAIGITAPDQAAACYSGEARAGPPGSCSGRPCRSRPSR